VVEHERDMVQSVSRAVTLLRQFSLEQPTYGVSELSRALELPKSIVFRLVRTLVAEGLLEEDKTTSLYRIGLGAFEIGSLYAEGTPLLKVAVPYLDELVDRHGHNAYLGVLDGANAVYVAAVEADSPLRVHASIGSRVPAYATAFGKAMLAELPDDRVRALLGHNGLTRLTAHTITSIDALIEHLHTVRACGYAINHQETHLGVGSVGASIRDRSSAAIAAISLSYPISLVGVTEVTDLALKVRDVAAAVSHRLSRIAIDTPKVTDAGRRRPGGG